MNVYIAIDAGQTHTECVAVDDGGAVVGEGTGGPSYAQDGSPLVRASFDAAIAALDVSPSDVRAVLAGATGGHIPGRLDAVRAYTRQRFEQAAIQVVPDGEFVLRSYVGDGDGGVLIAGTGSVAIGSFRGTLRTVGGYGYLFGDEGAGSWLVLEYVRRSLREADEDLPLSELTGDVCRHFGVDDIREIPGAIYARGVVDVNAIAGAAVLIVRAAAQGDARAEHLMQEAACELGGLAGRLARALGLPDRSAFPLYLAGGIWRAHGALFPGFRAALPPNVQWGLHRVETSPTLEVARYARRLSP